MRRTRRSRPSGAAPASQPLRRLRAPPPGPSTSSTPLPSPPCLPFRWRLPTCPSCPAAIASPPWRRCSGRFPQLAKQPQQLITSSSPDAPGAQARCSPSLAPPHPLNAPYQHTPLQQAAPPPSTLSRREFRELPIQIDVKVMSLGLVRAVHDLIYKYGRQHRVLWGSFNHEVRTVVVPVPASLAPKPGCQGRCIAWAC